MEITKEIAQRIIESTPVITEANVPYKGIEINHIGFNDADGNPFSYDNGDEYAIASFKAVSEYQFDKSVEAFVEEDYDTAVAGSLSMRVPVEKARLWSVKTPGTLVCHKVINNDGVEIMVARSYQPAVAIDSTKAKRTLADVLAGKAQARVAIEE